MTEYDAFISYRRSDGTAAARRIRQMLQSYRLPRGLRAGRRSRLTVFLDTAYERGAADFYSGTIAPALLASRWLVVVATPDAVKRPDGEDWIAREVADFAAGPNGGNVVVVRALGEFMAELPADIAARFPNVQIVDLRDQGWLGRISPQRAARVADEKLKLVGPIHDIALADMPRLRREEERRQVSRLGAVAGAAAAAVLLVAGLSLFALKSQWDGSQALKQSLSAARQSVLEIVGGYSDSEPLTSPLRDAALQNCDLANRLQLLAGGAEDANQALACRVEEQRALALTGQAGQKQKSVAAIAADLRAAAARAQQPDADPSSLGPVVLSGLRTWMALDNSDEPKRLYAEYQRQSGVTGLTTAAMTDDPAGELRSALDGFTRASEATYELASARQQAGDLEGARSDYAQALVDALKSDEALQQLHAALPSDSGTVAEWSSLADLVQQAAVGGASAAGGDKAAARQTLMTAMAYFSRSASEDFAEPRRQAARRAAIAGALYAIDGDPAVGEPMPQALWDCLSNGYAAVSDANVSDDDPDKQEGARILSSCLDSAAHITDARRAEALRLWKANDLPHNADMLRLVIADSLRVNSYRQYRGPWDELYVAIADKDLSISAATAGDAAGAKAARDAALALFQPYVHFDQVDDTASRVAEAHAAYDYLMQNPGPAQ